VSRSATCPSPSPPKPALSYYPLPTTYGCAQRRRFRAGGRAGSKIEN
jgi:hypothetical protein